MHLLLVKPFAQEIKDIVLLLWEETCTEKKAKQNKIKKLPLNAGPWYELGNDLVMYLGLSVICKGCKELVFHKRKKSVEML